MLPCGRAFEHAVGLIRSQGLKDVGIHLALDEEKPILDPSEIPSLVTEQGTFLPRGVLLKRLLTKKIDLYEVKAELDAQCRKCIDAELPLTHVDGHGHLHVYPYLSEIVIELSKRHSISRTRIPYEALGCIQYRQLSQWLRKVIVSLFSLWARPLYVKAGFLFPETFLGTAHGGRLDSTSLGYLFTQLSEKGINEIMVHPGYHDEEEMARYDWWKNRWEEELGALCKCSKDELSTRENLCFVDYHSLHNSHP